MTKQVSAIVLAGGKSSRMGTDKASIRLDSGLTLLQSTVDKLATVADEIIVVTDGRSYPGITTRVKWIKDVLPGAGSLVGLYSGLREAGSKYAFAVACDMPFLNTGLIKYMLSLPHDYDILVPRTGHLYEPLHAVYSRSCLQPMEKMIGAGQMKIQDLFDRVAVRHIGEETIRLFDPLRKALLNVNSPDQLNHAREICLNVARTAA